MAITFEKIQPGATLYDCHRTKLGNTKMTRWGLWHVRVFSVDAEKREAVVSWNSNPQQTWPARRLEKLYAKPPKKYTEQRSL